MSNDAAERLRDYIHTTAFTPEEQVQAEADLAEALAVARRATAERIRTRINAGTMTQDFSAVEAAAGAQVLQDIHAILDAEAQR